MPDSETSIHPEAFGAALEEDGEAFVGHLIAEAETPLDGGGNSLAARKEVLDRLKTRKDTLTWPALYEFDRLVLEMASDKELIAQAPGLYRRYCQERGQPIDPHDPAMNPSLGGTDVTALRARMLEILRALHWSYTFGPIRETSRVRLVWEVMLVMALATVIAGGLVALLRNAPFFTMLTTVVYAGIMGAMVSCARRLGNVSTTDDALRSIGALKNSRYVLIFSPTTGAVFAVVTMLLFMGGLMTGVLFPKFAEPTTVLGGGWWTHALQPANGSSFALLVLWCFISGFAEQFIPDALDGLTKRAATKKTDDEKEGSSASQ